MLPFRRQEQPPRARREQQVLKSLNGSRRDVVLLMKAGLSLDEAIEKAEQTKARAHAKVDTVFAPITAGIAERERRKRQRIDPSGSLGDTPGDQQTILPDPLVTEQPEDQHVLKGGIVTLRWADEE